MATAWIREFVDRETFHTISYVASISWIMLWPLFVAPPVVSKLESTPDYRCNGEDKAQVHDKCFSQFKQYYEETGANVFVTFFSIINFSAITMVFFIYSQCVRRKVRINSQGDGTLLFCAYFVQLASRFVLHIISVVLGILLYLKNDLNFECYIKTEGSDWVHLRASNFTGKAQMYECFIHRETTGFYLTVALIMLNGVFTLVAVAEIIWMLIQSRGHCTKNEDFRRLYLNLNFERVPTDEPDYSGPSVPLESIKFKIMTEVTLELRKSTEQGDEVAMLLRKSYKTNVYKLAKLDLGFTNMTDQGAECISEALKNDNCKLTQLCLDGNRIGNIGAKYLSDALRNKNCKLTLLKLGEDITNGGVAFLKFSLTDSNCKLTELHVSGDKIGDKGASYLSRALKAANCKVTKLYLHGNKIGDTGARYLAKALNDCKLEELTLIANQMGDAGVEHMHIALQYGNHSLNKLCLEGNKIHEENFVQEQRIGKTTVSVGKCRRRENRSPPSGVKTKPIAKTASDETTKKLTYSP
ncbi:uncharacterized protein LOC114957536 [Acropora millepora]|uniref:uncharacterized protein LOC114957536 n=1 Tax=Acropora millepora TaxID=45264 RepID=UPI001CF383D6|nr:uncharacterized protein LOC114957536 [Acropora millepora]